MFYWQCYPLYDFSHLVPLKSHRLLCFTVFSALPWEAIYLVNAMELCGLHHKSSRFSSLMRCCWQDSLHLDMVRFSLFKDYVLQNQSN